MAGASLFAVVLAFNGWWYWRDSRALPDLESLSDLMRREKYDAVESALRERLRRSPHDGEARMMLARALAGQGDLLGCARQLHEVPFWSPRKAEAFLREGQTYLKLDRARDAELAWQSALKGDPLHPLAPEYSYDISQELLKLFAIEDRWEDAYPVIWSAYDHATPAERPVLLAMRMRAELERVAPKESSVVLKRYVAADDDDWEAIHSLARAERALGNVDQAERLFQTCLKGNPDNVRAWHNYLAMLLEQGEEDRFLALLIAAPKSADSEPETWMFRGIASENKQDSQTAMACFRRAIELNPFVPRYYYRLATLEQRLGLHDEARAHRTRTKEMNEARAELSTAYTDFFAARARTQGAPEMKSVCKRLASICATLGWSRAAKGWSRLANVP